MHIVRYNHRSLKQGNYYSDWYFSFLRMGFVPIGIFGALILKKNTVCVIPHEAIDFAGRQTFKFIIRHLSIWMFYKILFKILSRKEVNLIFLSKNDYKDVERKSKFLKKFKQYTLVTHTKSALSTFMAENVKVTWLPFGWSNVTIDNRKKVSKEIWLGFRGNANVDWLSYDRDKIFGEFEGLNSLYKIDVKISKNGEHFLYGEEYYSWLEKCKFQLNSESANGTTSPRIFEQMVLGVCPVAIPGDYEGLIVPYQNYIPISADIKNTIDDMNKEDLVQSIIDNNKKLASKYEISEMVKNFFNKL